MKVTLTTLTSRYGSVDALNANFEALADAIENTLSLDGTTPNALEANLDLNSHRIINLPSPSANSDAATKGYVDTITGSLNNYLDEIQTVADNIDDVVAVAAIDTDDMAAVASNATNINTVAGISSAITTVAGISSAISSVNSNAADISAVADNETNIDAVAANETNIDAVAGNSTNINSVASNSSNINTVASNSTNINTVAGISSNVTTVAGISSAVSTVATNITDIQNAEENAAAAIAAKVAAESARDSTLASFDSFDDRYLGPKTDDPLVDNDGNALVAGALYFNSSAGAMKVYTGSGWVAAYVSGTDFLSLSGGTLTGPLILYGNPVANLSAAPKQYVDSTATSKAVAFSIVFGG